MLQPKRSKHRKQQKGRIREIAKRGASIAFGSFALKSLDPIWLTNRQLESARQAMTRAMKREGAEWDMWTEKWLKRVEQYYNLS